MATEAIQKSNVQEQLSLLLEKVSKIELSVEEINDDLHQVKPSYLKKLEKIKRGKMHHFENKEDFLHFLENEI